MISRKFFHPSFHNFAERRTETTYKYSECDDILIATIGWVKQILLFFLHDSDTQLWHQIFEMQEIFLDEPLNIKISFRYLWYISWSQFRYQNSDYAEIVAVGLH